MEKFSKNNCIEEAFDVDKDRSEMRRDQIDFMISSYFRKKLIKRIFLI
jgi:hypothetical protein